MKSSDPLLAAWRRTVARAKDLPAIFNTRGEVVRKFSEIEERARDFEKEKAAADFPRIRMFTVALPLMYSKGILLGAFEGETLVGDKRLRWSPGDVLVVPGWMSCTHRVTKEAVLFSFSDRSLQEKVGLWREERAAQV